MMDYFCDKTIKRKSKTKHLKSKNHFNMKSYIRDEHIVGDVYWKDFYRVIRDYVDINRKKFPIFKTVVRCKLFNKDLVICYDKTKKRLIRYGFGDVSRRSILLFQASRHGQFLHIAFARDVTETVGRWIIVNHKHDDYASTALTFIDVTNTNQQAGDEIGREKLEYIYIFEKSKGEA